ncbi:MAG: 5'-nucleotidase C-terminal domain-containing protein [Acidobacteria bacterium]|nr:5'-nucleotidase C-terminal domain-containing protein [Acidobacteriota bacterium]
MIYPRVLMRLVLVTLLAACSLVAFAQDQESSPTWSERLVDITLLQLNDVYQISPVDKGRNAGLARVAALRKKIISESPNTLFFLGGDTISPSVASSIFKGEQMIASWNVLGLDIAVLGNHEFDFGDDVLIKRMSESKFVWLGSNVIDRQSGKPFNNMPPFVIRNIAGIRVGVLGLLTPETETSSKPGANIRFVDPIATAKRLARKMREEGAQIVIAVTHMNLSDDKRLAQTGLVDIILGGHEHELLQSLAGRTPIFKWGSDARHLGRIDLHIRVSSGKIDSIDWAAIPVNDSIANDPEAASVIAEFEKKLSVELDKTIGSTTVELDAIQPHNRSRETNLGNLVADAFREGTDADVALVNGGSIRSNTTYSTGPLSKRDIISIMPFENPVVKVEVTGAILKAALENGVSQVVEEKESGRFPQVSGLLFEYDGGRPPGSRIVKVTIKGQPLDLQKIYSVAATAYLISGGDGYKMFKNSKYLINDESAQIDATIISNSISAKGQVSPQVEGRIRRVDTQLGVSL